MPSSVSSNSSSSTPTTAKKTAKLLYAELEMIELAIADLEAEANVLKPPRM